MAMLLSDFRYTGAQCDVQFSSPCKRGPKIRRLKEMAYIDLTVRNYIILLSICGMRIQVGSNALPG